MLDHVSYHACIRYLDRVLGLPVADWLVGTEHLNEKLRAELCCERAGVPVAEVRKAILSKPVALAILSNFCDVTVRYEGFAYIIKNRIVVSIYTAAMRKRDLRHDRPATTQSRPSAKRDIHKAQRRNRKRTYQNGGEQ